MQFLLAGAQQNSPGCEFQGSSVLNSARSSHQSTMHMSWGEWGGDFP
jgi:hypothetical protein